MLRFTSSSIADSDPVNFESAPNQRSSQSRWTDVSNLPHFIYLKEMSTRSDRETNIVAAQDLLHPDKDREYLQFCFG